MIGSLRGSFLERLTKNEVLIEVQGVGYRLTVSPATIARLGATGSSVFVYVHTHVREDALVLFGFASRDESACFETLISAHGVGPSLALSILSSLTPSSLRMAIASDDVDALTVVPGVGKKTAARLLIELKSKLDVMGSDYSVAIAAAGDGLSDVPEHDARNDVRAALTELGYGTEEVRATIRKLPLDGDAATLLRQALALLAGG